MSDDKFIKTNPVGNSVPVAPGVDATHESFNPVVSDLGKSLNLSTELLGTVGTSQQCQGSGGSIWGTVAPSTNSTED